MKITYTLTIGPMPESKMRPILAALKETNLPYELDADVEMPEEKKAKPKANGNAILSMTGKRAQKGSVREQVLTVFEKLEKKHGIGDVTRKMLRDDCNKKGVDSQIIYQLLRDGYLKVLT